MSIKDSFIPYDELLELFGVQRVNALFRCLEQNRIPFILDKRNKPLVLRTAIEKGVNSEDGEQETAVSFT